MRPSIPPRLQSLTRSTCIGLSAALLAGTGHAHDGHGLFGAHWHATDTLGFVALALAVGAALWLSRK
ncbi:hypothetical protein [Aquabacterium sp. A08]|uniref:hypothetical protein n=1 Tax=Aquabacterium sp. A08 TaxID=2718532 RepID=UPI0014224484|nr:hypothetical protein [Aquabacterium sp. A08]NIC40204.1 hypothetical protein [Aquabacterium sp. A08]